MYKTRVPHPTALIKVSVKITADGEDELAEL